MVSMALSDNSSPPCLCTGVMRREARTKTRRKREKEMGWGRRGGMTG